MKNNISPHVSIYKFPITAVSSITHRLTGLACTGIFILSGAYCLLQPENRNYIQKYYTDIDWKLKKAIHYGVFFPINYHLLGDIRHHIWDKYPRFLQNNKVGKSSYALFGCSIVTTTFLIENINIKTGNVLP